MKLVPFTPREQDPEETPGGVLENAKKQPYDRLLVVGYHDDGLLYYDHTGMSGPELVYMLLDTIDQIRGSE